ncbi:chymotrypsin-2-like [Teleopsis dalmanni]|uniref:chymotrypsin-2-like n=1 Tax=Teleopsis dalmanni TaxID=139649 RepID=UPI0018CE994C|nr:chymotrypsin-2-like [Teleopsis dalmanni]
MYNRMNISVALLLLTAFIGYSDALRYYGDPSYVGLKYKDTKPPAVPRQSRIQTENYVLGGHVAANGAVPFQVSIQNRFGNHFCGGAIIDDQYVLTAASCVGGLQKSNIKVVTGTNDWMGLAIQYEVEDIIIHCNFDKPLYHNDIALIKLATLVAYDDVTKNITVAELNELVPGETLTFTGWGEDQEGANYPNDLKQLNVLYISNTDCKAAYGNVDDVDLGHVCTKSPVGEGACHGDTGGPLINSKGQLVGINNFGIPCGRGFPDVFASVAFYNDWIRTTIKGCNLES